MLLPNNRVTIFGAGAIGLAHFDAFYSLGCDVRCVNQSGGCKTTAAGHKVEITPVSSFVMESLRETGVVISLPIEHQLKLYFEVIKHKPSFVLIEKPASLDLSGLKKTVKDYPDIIKRTYVGYNRRFFDSIIGLKKILENKKIYSISVDWSENIPRLQSLVDNKSLLESWHLANSSHMFDLAAFLDGSESYTLKYKYLNGMSSFNSLPGFGLIHMISANSVSMEFRFNFIQSGSWSLEVISASGRYRLAPLEQLTKFNTKTFSFKPIINGNQTSQFKEGFINQARACMNSSKYLCNFESNYKNLNMLNMILLGE